MTVTIRLAEWPKDIAAVAAIDTAFETDRIYRVTQDGLAISLKEETVSPAVLAESGTGPKREHAFPGR